MKSKRYAMSEAVRVYAKQAGDFELQNKAAEIRLLAEREQVNCCLHGKEPRNAR